MNRYRSTHTKSQKLIEEEKPDPPSSAFLKAYFIIIGMNGMIPFFVFLAEADFFDENYPDYLFNFYSLLPSNIAVPISFLAMKYFSKLSLNKKIIFCTCLMTIFFSVLPLFPIYKPKNFESKFFLKILKAIY